MTGSGSEGVNDLFVDDTMAGAKNVVGLTFEVRTVEGTEGAVASMKTSRISACRSAIRRDNRLKPTFALA